MIEPKEFYRNFDELLKNIRQRKTGKNFICSILMELQQTFGEELNIGNLHVYEEKGDEFIHVRPAGLSPNQSHDKISASSEAIQLVLKHGSYIYDNFDFRIDSEASGGSPLYAAVIIRSPDYRWLAVFELNDGWIREEVLFSLNAVRTAINYRLFSDAVKSELEQAAQIQKSLLPQHQPDIQGYEIAARSQPTEIVGGDLYDYFEFEDELFGVSIGDASGHGLPAALLVRDVVVGMRMGIEKHMKMVYTFERLNSVIYRSSYSSRFVSLFYGEIERDGHLIFVNAGHPPPFVVHGEKVTDMKATGLILGALPEIKFHRSFVRMEPNSVLVLYTDGLFERENMAEEMYTIDRLKKLVMKNQEKSPQEILELIFDKVFEYGSRTKWEDDSTLVVIKRLDS